MSTQVERPAPPGDRPEFQAATKQLDKAILTPAADPLDELAAHVDGTFVVVVHLTGDKYRRRCFLTTKAAERAARNAQAAGHNAEIYLAELKPLWRLKGWESTS
jgi:hypothetical protein